MPSFFFQSPAHHRDLLSFPTRRSSDLALFIGQSEKYHGPLEEPLFAQYLKSGSRSEEHTSELQSQLHLLCPLFFFNHPPTTEIFSLSLHDALPILLSLSVNLKSIMVPLKSLFLPNI